MEEEEDEGDEAKPRSMSTSYPGTSAAAALFRGAELDDEPAGGSAISEAGSAEPNAASFYLFQLPTTLPLKGKLPQTASGPARSGRGAGKGMEHVMSGAEYLAALAGSGSGSSGGKAPAAAMPGHPGEVSGAKGSPETQMDLSHLGSGQLGELVVYESGRVALVIGEHELDVQPGTVCSCEQEVVAVGMPQIPGGPVDLHRLGKMKERLVVTPNVDHLLRSRE